MEDQEVADRGRFQFRLVVILRDVARADAPRRQHADKAQQRSLDQVDRGRFQWLHEAAGQADRDAVAIPLPPPHPGGEAQDIGLGQRVALDIAEQPVERRLAIQIAAAIDDPVAGAVRSEERRVGKECVRTCRYRWSPYPYKKKTDTNATTKLTTEQK